MSGEVMHGEIASSNYMVDGSFYMPIIELHLQNLSLLLRGSLHQFMPIMVYN